MLSERFKQFVESVAHDLQNAFKINYSHEYDLNAIEDFFEEAGCHFVFWNGEGERGKAHFKDGVIYMNCTREEIEKSTYVYNETSAMTLKELKILFHEIWHYLSQQFEPLQSSDTKTKTVYSYSDSFPTDVSEMSANYFSRAMLMPKDLFVTKVAENTNLTGVCNVFAVAKFFRVEYADVIARGKDLNLWNMKVGI